MNELMAVRAEVVRTGRAMLDCGLVAGTWGNVSIRVPGTELVAVTPSGRDYRNLRPEDIAVVDLQGKQTAGELTPSTEVPLHLAIYAARPDIGAIVHTHSIFASACAAARRPLPPVIEDLVQLSGGTIEVAAYALPGTEELAANAVAALADRQAVLLANHGAVGCGRTSAEALLACELVEKGAQIYIYANLLGGAQILSDGDVAAMRRFYVEHYRRRQEGEE
ncbi:class II aldolase/adducin family protein [Anaeroselena agilis]|uniref:Class II aldolase/adducin family protein n=1 Tax=Anaeroselena agilis TaxID=3063788 RepID=A0ABU3NXC1_9FIRM|nr:class II aldolase/adducin family protein [Selenomonadales bacterium 4137-cl]